MCQWFEMGHASTLRPLTNQWLSETVRSVQQRSAISHSAVVACISEIRAGACRGHTHPRSNICNSPWHTLSASAELSNRKLKKILHSMVIFPLIYIYISLCRVPVQCWLTSGLIASVYSDMLIRDGRCEVCEMR